MRKAVAGIVGICCVLLAASDVRAQDMDTLFRQFNSAQNAGNYAQAEQIARRMLQASSTPGWQAASLNSLGRALNSQRKLSEAEQQLKRAIAIRLNAGNVNIGWIPSNLGMVYMNQKRFDEAEVQFQRALKFFEGQNPRSADVASMLSNLGSLEHDREEYEKSLEYHRRALAMRQAIFGESSENVGYTLQHIADRYRHLQRYAESDETFKRAISTLEKTIGPDHHELAICLSSSAKLHRETKNFVAAEAADRRALAIREKLHGPYDGSVADTLESLVADLEPQDRTEEAGQLKERVAAIKARKPRIEVIAASAKVRDGSKTVATVNKGQQFDVIQTNASFFGVAIEVESEKKTGWLANSDVKLVGYITPVASDLDKAIRWQSFTPPGAKAAVSMPGSPRHETQTGAGVQADIYIVDSDDATYRIGYFEMPKGTVMNREAGANAYAAARKGKIKSKKNIEVDYYPAYEVDVTLPDGSISRVRNLMVNRRYYELSVQTQASLIDGENANKFFSSFKLKD